MQDSKNDKESFNEILTNEEALHDPAPECKNNMLPLKSHSDDIGHSKNICKDKNKKNHNFLVLVLDYMGLKDQTTTKEVGTLILLGGMLLLFIISVTGFFVMWFTEYYDNSMLSNIILANNSETAQHWMNPNPKYDTLLKVHIFNYTNIETYLSGVDDKILVEDLGPLTYKEHTTKVNVSFNNNFTVTFRDHRSYKFLPEKSTFRETDEFVLPNVPLLTAAVKVDNMNLFKKLAATQFINSFKEDAFKRLTAHEFLWGYRDKIVSLDFGTGSTHFGLLMNRNGTSVDSLQINTGEDDLRKFSIISQFNGMPFLDFWSDDVCNRIDGSDASMFPPYNLENRDDLFVFLQVLCRKVPLHFEKEVTILNNIEALRYRTPLNVFANPRQNPENYCYCHNTQRCLPSGVINATQCYNGAPIYPSFPHFFSGDPVIYKDFEGIKPEADLHQTFADIHPRFAFPISGASRIQINIAVHKSSIIKNKINRIEEGTILPLIWIEITSGDFTEEIIDNLYVSTVGINAIQYALKYGTLLTCVTSFSLIVAVFYYLNRRREEQLMQNENRIITELEVLNTLQLVAINEP